MRGQNGGACLYVCMFTMAVYVLCMVVSSTACVNNKSKVGTSANKTDFSVWCEQA